MADGIYQVRVVQNFVFENDYTGMGVLVLKKEGETVRKFYGVINPLTFSNVDVSKFSGVYPEIGTEMTIQRKGRELIIKEIHKKK